MPATVGMTGNGYRGHGPLLRHETNIDGFVVRPGKVAYFSGCEARPGRFSQPPGSKSLDRNG